MFCKKNITVFINTLILSTSALSANPASSAHDKIMQELRKGEAAYQKVSKKTILRNPILHWLAGATCVLNLITQIPQAEQAKMSIQCSCCKTYRLSCAEFSGHVLAAGWTAEFAELKQVLTSKQTNGITTFMIKTANTKNISCPQCEKYTGWQKQT